MPTAMFLDAAGTLNAAGSTLTETFTTVSTTGVAGTTIEGIVADPDPTSASHRLAHAARHIRRRRFARDRRKRTIRRGVRPFPRRDGSSNRASVPARRDAWREVRSRPPAAASFHFLRAAAPLFGGLAAGVRASRAASALSVRSTRRWKPRSCHRPRKFPCPCARAIRPRGSGPAPRRPRGRGAAWKYRGPPMRQLLEFADKRPARPRKSWEFHRQQSQPKQR